MRALIELHYLPSLEYFSIFLLYPEIILEKQEHYVKQSYRNRCTINTANGIQNLVIPVTAKHNKAAINEVRIDYSTKWQNLHWRAIRSAYGKAPFFEYYGDKLHQIIFSSKETLYELNYHLLSFCLQSLHFEVSLSESTLYEKVASNGVIDLRSNITPKIPYTERSFLAPVTYVQVFGNKFVSNLSIIDLLFSEGPNAMQILQSSTRGYLNK